MARRYLSALLCSFGLVAALGTTAEAQLPTVTGDSFTQNVIPGEFVSIDILANTNGTVYSAYVDLTIDQFAVLDPDGIPNYTTAFDAILDVSIEENIVGASIQLAIAVPFGVTGVNLVGQPLVTFDYTVGAFTLFDETVDVLVNDADFDETPAILTDGLVTLVNGYGDVTLSDDVSALDASNILQEVVGLFPAADFTDPAVFDRGDVTGNFAISALDASHVLAHVVAGGFYTFPVQGAPAKQAPSFASSRALSWVESGSGYDLVVSAPSGVLAGQLTLDADASVEITGDYVAANRVDGAVHVAFARADDSSPVLLHIDGVAIAPTIEQAMLNEGLIEVQNIASFSATPLTFALAQNAPNPFNPSTSINFTIPEPGDVMLAIYNMNGQLVRTLVDGTVSAGAHEIVWDARNSSGASVASGAYLYRLVSGDDVQIRRMILAR